MPTADQLEQRVRERLSVLKTDGLLRTLRAPSGIDLSSNDYLGLSSHPLLKERMAAAVMREGCGSTGSRLLRGERECFASIERRFAEFKGTERSLYFSSGYLANLGVLTAFIEESDAVFCDERIHASLIDGVRLARARRGSPAPEIFPHNDVSKLERLLGEDAGAGQKFVITESLFSMDGDIAPLGQLAALCRANKAALIVDEAHAVGIYGDRGSGLIEAAGIGSDVFLSINTAGKALGVSGAFVAGPAWAIEFLIQRARPFIFSTAPPPPVAAALDASLDVITAEPERRARLRSRAVYLRQRLAACGIDTGGTDCAATSESQIIPVVIGENERAVAAAEALAQAGFDVRAIRPPTVPRGTARLRISVNVNLSEATLDRFVAALGAALDRTASCSAASS